MTDGTTGVAGGAAHHSALGSLSARFSKLERLKASQAADGSRRPGGQCVPRMVSENRPSVVASPVLGAGIIARSTWQQQQQQQQQFQQQQFPQLHPYGFGAPRNVAVAHTLVGGSWVWPYGCVPAYPPAWGDYSRGSGGRDGPYYAPPAHRRGRGAYNPSYRYQGPSPYYPSSRGGFRGRGRGSRVAYFGRTGAACDARGGTKRVTADQLNRELDEYNRSRANTSATSPATAPTAASTRPSEIKDRLDADLDAYMAETAADSDEDLQIVHAPEGDFGSWKEDRRE